MKCIKIFLHGLWYQGAFWCWFLGFWGLPVDFLLFFGVFLGARMGFFVCLISFLGVLVFLFGFFFV